MTVKSWVARLSSRDMRHSIIRRSFLLLFFVFPAYFFNYLFLIAAGRMLSGEAFGILYTGISFTNVIIGPTVILNLFFAKRITVAMAQGGTAAATAEFSAVVRYTVRFGLIAALVVLIVMTFLASFMHIESFLLLLVIIVTAYAIYITETTRAAFQGFKRFTALGLETLSWMLLRFLLGVSGIYVIGSVWAGFLGIALAAVVVFIVFYAILIRQSDGSVVHADHWEKGEIRRLVYFAGSFSVFMGMMYLDNIMAYLELNRSDLGLYSSASVVAKAILIITTPIMQVFFPVMVEQSAAGAGIRVTDAVKSLGATVGVSSILAVVICAYPEFLVTRVLGLRHVNADVIRAVALSTIPLSIIRVCVVMQLARGKDRHPLYLLPLVLAQMLILHFQSGNLTAFAWAFAASCWGVMVYYAVLCMPKNTQPAVEGAA